MLGWQETLMAMLLCFSLGGVEGCDDDSGYN